LATKSSRNKSNGPAAIVAAIKRVPLEYRLLAAVAAIWLIATGIGELSFRRNRTDLFVDSIALLAMLAAGLIFLRATRIWAPAGEWREQWRTSYLRRYVRAWTEGFGEYRLALPIVLFAALSAAAGIVGYKLTGYYRYTEEKWLIAYAVVYALAVLPWGLGFAAKFRVLLAGAKDVAEGDLRTSVELPGRGVLAEMASHMNRMKLGYRKALEVQIRSERLKSELITNVSHDLKTPLTSIINYVDLMKSEAPGSERYAEYVDVLDRKSLRLKALIDDLFEASKMASGAVELDIKRIDVAALLSQAVAEFADKFEQSGLSLRVKLGRSPIHAYLDGNKTWRIFENLLANALKYSMTGTRVYVSLDEEDGRVAFRIQNTSSYEIDFAPDELFERFKRADVSRHTEGSGLGLAIAKSIVELQGGEIRIEVSGDQFLVAVTFVGDEEGR